MYYCIDPTVKLKPKGETIVSFFNTTFYRLMQTAAAKHIKLGFQCRLKSSHIGLPIAYVCVKQTETSPCRFIVLCVTAPFVHFGVTRYSLYKRVRRAAEKERKIRVTIISTGSKK